VTMNNSGDDRLARVQDVAARLSVPVSWVYAQAEAGLLPSYKVGRYRRFNMAEIERFLEGRREGPAVTALLKEKT
jgi:excisionase family DNA binding protein